MPPLTLSPHSGGGSRVLEDQLSRHDPGANDLARTIDVLQEKVESASPLFKAARQVGPFPSGHDARDDVEGDQALLRLGIPIDRERDADFSEKELCLVAAMFQKLRRRGIQPVFQHPVRFPGLPPCPVISSKYWIGRHRLALLPAARRGAIVQPRGTIRPNTRKIRTAAEAAPEQKKAKCRSGGRPPYSPKPTSTSRILPSSPREFRSPTTKLTETALR